VSKATALGFALSLRRKSALHFTTMWFHCGSSVNESASERGVTPDKSRFVAIAGKASKCWKHQHKEEEKSASSVMRITRRQSERSHAVKKLTPLSENNNATFHLRRSV
jgi:hypothetical protein